MYINALEQFLLLLDHNRSESETFTTLILSFIFAQIKFMLDNIYFTKDVFIFDNTNNSYELNELCKKVDLDFLQKHNIDPYKTIIAEAFHQSLMLKADAYYNAKIKFNSRLIHPIFYDIKTKVMYPTHLLSVRDFLSDIIDYGNKSKNFIIIGNCIPTEEFESSIKQLPETDILRQISPAEKELILTQPFFGATGRPFMDKKLIEIYKVNQEYMEFIIENFRKNLYIKKKIRIDA